ncbi:NAD(P)-dependent alcohol dehydrogenase [Microbacterium sp. 179-B 1A2 NHS]|uniref:NAD(P)-dependent alcohol dehydrogenase n=1 Tax=Microbacterium sp. 179-B 1A2 NHS TaxID=3142383 RepID=UPI0039A171E5
MSTDATAIPATMPAWTQHRYGGPDDVALEDVPVPVPGPGDVLVRIRAVGLNSADVRVLRGDPLLIRAAFGLRRPRVTVQGRDVAGTVVAAGTAVSGLRVGDEVFGEITGGGLGPYAVAAAAKLVRRPPNLEAITAAALPMAGGTAWQALDKAGLGGSDAAGRVLVVGAGGGVGTLTVQLAVLRGLEVTALTGERALPLLRDMGAVAVHDYRRTDIADLGTGRFDAVIVIAGSHPLRALRRLVVAGGIVVLVSGGGNRVTGPIGPIARAAVMSIGASRRIRPLAATATPAITARLRDLAASGSLVPHIERTFPLSDARAALAHLDTGHAIGKTVVVAG